MEIRLPDEKLTRIRHEVAGWLQRRSATKRQILSLVGLLQHATKVIRQGRTFVARMYKAAAKVEELSYYTRLNKEIKSDLFRWHYFLEHWNGLSLLRPVKQVIPADLQFRQMHLACGAVGPFGATISFSGLGPRTGRMSTSWLKSWLQS